MYSTYRKFALQLSMDIIVTSKKKGNSHPGGVPHKFFINITVEIKREETEFITQYTS